MLQAIWKWKLKKKNGQLVIADDEGLQRTYEEMLQTRKDYIKQMMRGLQQKDDEGLIQREAGRVEERERGGKGGEVGGVETKNVLTGYQSALGWV